MNSLEYIDREISSTEIDLWYSKRLLIENPPNEELKKEMLEVKINVLERNMKCLQQIKSEVEAWYVVKEDIDYQEIEYCDERPEYTYEYKKWSFKLTEDNPNFEEKSKKLKKGLEINRSNNYEKY